MTPPSAAALAPVVPLRWMAIVLQVALVAMGWLIFPTEVPPLGLVAVVLAVSVASNVGLRALAARQRLTESWATGALILDVGVVTALLLAAQGPANPFTALYLVSVTVAASVLSRRDTVAVVVLSVLAYGTLFLVVGGDGGEHAHHGGGAAMKAHLLGMWVAYAVAAPFVAYAILVLRASLDRARRRTAAAERLASVGTLAVGVAHELSTPMGTIALAADGLAARHRDDPDVGLIRAQVARSREILRRLAADAGHPSGPSPEPTRLDALVQRVVAGLDVDLDIVWELGGHDHVEVSVAPAATVRALRGLVDNGLDASPEGEPVRLGVVVSERTVTIEVVDRGEGMGAEVLDRVGEPFFTTKGHEGMGLGVFFARTVAEQQGGALQFSSGDDGVGTVARVVLPR